MDVVVHFDTADIARAMRKAGGAAIPVIVLFIYSAPPKLNLYRIRLFVHTEGIVPLL